MFLRNLNRSQLFKGWTVLFSQWITIYGINKYYKVLLSCPVDSDLCNGLSYPSWCQSNTFSYVAIINEIAGCCVIWAFNGITILVHVYELWINVTNNWSPGRHWPYTFLWSATIILHLLTMLFSTLFVKIHCQEHLCGM